MANPATFNIKLCSYNMYGFNNGLNMLYNICESFDFILLQEHWLQSADLHKLNNVHNNFTSFSVSAMDSKIENGLLVGRPFGGTAILCKNNFLPYIELIETDSITGRFVSLRYHYNTIDILITNVYFPYFKTSLDYTIDCCSLIAKLEHIIDNFPNCKHVLAGDYNFNCTDNNVGYSLFKHIIDDHHLVCCDNLCHNPCINYTYCHNSFSFFMD